MLPESEKALPFIISELYSMSNEKSLPDIRVSLRISAGAVALCSLIAFFFGPGELLSLFLAASVHELGHVFTLLLQDCTPESLQIAAGGLLIRYRGGEGGMPGFYRAVSGPAAGLLLAAVLLFSPDPLLQNTSRLSLVFSAGNLLPFSELDGGSMLFCLWEAVTGTAPSFRVIRIFDVLTAASVLLLGILCCPQLLFWGFWLFLSLWGRTRRD